MAAAGFRSLATVDSEEDSTPGLEAQIWMRRWKQPLGAVLVGFGLMLVLVGLIGSGSTLGDDRGARPVLVRHRSEDLVLTSAKQELPEQNGPYMCESSTDFGQVVHPERKGMALDDTTFEHCANQVPYMWPNTKQKLLSVRLFKAWGMTDPKFFHTDMMKAWEGLKTFAEASGARFLLGVSVTCNTQRDEREWAAGRRFIEYVGAQHIMGLAVGNEIDLQVGASNGGCLNNLWNRGGYLNTLIKRVEEFDSIPGMSSLPVTAVFSNNAMGGSPFTSKVTRFLKGAWKKFGTRFVFSINVYPQFSQGLRQAGCHGAVQVGTKFSMDTPAGFTAAVVKALRRKLDSMGARGMKLWLGETGWATHGWCVLGCSEACHSKATHRRYYEGFLKWDLTAGNGTEADHVFYFTLRDSSVFGKREEFGLIPRCGSKHCKF